MGLVFLFTDDETEADAILINTCCFIGDAKEESALILFFRYGPLAKEGKCRA